MSEAFWEVRRERVGGSDIILVPRGMKDLAKRPRPLAPAERTSYIWRWRHAWEGEVRLHCFEHGLVW